MSRPKSVTVISWFLIVTGAFSFLGALSAFGPEAWAMWNDMGVNPTYVSANAFTGGAVQIIAGYAMLQQMAWGRTLYVAYYPLSLAASWFMYGEAFTFTVLPGALFFLGILFFLYRPEAENYFAGNYTPNTALHRALAAHRTAERNDSDLKRIFGIVTLVGGGFLTYMCLIVAGFADEPIMQVVLLIFFGTPALLALGVGTFLWGRTRWAESAGWTFAVVGAVGVMNAVTMWFMSQTAYWKQVTAGVEEGLVETMIYAGMGGGLLGVLGLYLLSRQYAMDKAAVEEQPAPSID